MRTLQSTLVSKEKNELRPQVDPAHYLKGYDTKQRFASYWHQINEMLELAPDNTLEIGIGNSFVSDYLRKIKFNIITLDLDERLLPDVAASVTYIPFKNESFDLVVCCEVLEHIPFQFFHKALSEIRRVTRNYAIISLPDCSRVYRIQIQIPKYGEIKKLIELPRLKIPKHKFDGEHYWEIGKYEYPLQKITDIITKTRFCIKKCYRVFEIPYHRFFILIKEVS